MPKADASERCLQHADGHADPNLAVTACSIAVFRDFLLRKVGETKNGGEVALLQPYRWPGSCPALALTCLYLALSCLFSSVSSSI